MYVNETGALVDLDLFYGELPANPAERFRRYPEIGGQHVLGNALRQRFGTGFDEFEISFLGALTQRTRQPLLRRYETVLKNDAKIAFELWDPVQHFIFGLRCQHQQLRILERLNII